VDGDVWNYIFLPIAWATGNGRAEGILFSCTKQPLNYHIFYDYFMQHDVFTNEKIITTLT